MESVPLDVMPEHDPGPARSLGVMHYVRAPHRQVAALVALSGEYSQFGAAWADYEKDSVDLPGAAALQNEVKKLKRQQGDISVGLIGVPEVSAA